MKGLVLGDADVVRLMDNKLSTGSSDIISAGLKKDGSFSARSSIASEQEFNVLQKYVHHTFENIGKDITEGVIDIAPYKRIKRHVRSVTSNLFVSLMNHLKITNSVR